jgi:hypothetical protein
VRQYTYLALSVTPVSRDDDAMWVRLYEWMIMDGEAPLPDVGTVLRHVGIRVRGMPMVADLNSLNGVVAVDSAGIADSSDAEYRLTGVAGVVRDVEQAMTAGAADYGFAEFVLAVDDDRFHVQFDARDREVFQDSRVTVTGKLSLIGAYEWDGFELGETRVDWLVEAVVAVGTGDALLNLVHLLNG